MGQEAEVRSCSSEPDQRKKVCVLGCGAMGTVLANLVARNLAESKEYEQKVTPQQT